MPPYVYSSPEWYQKEVELIFRKNWLMAVREEEIPNPGDYVRLDFFKEPLIVIRGQDRVVRTLSASCRHRGAELISGSGNCRALVCPYHGWAYSLSGRLIAAPSMNGVGGFHLSDWRLPEVRTEIWGGFVFINFDNDALSLMESLGEFARRFEQYHLDDIKLVRKWTYKVNCNWKIWTENSRETYHLGTVHRPSFERFRPDGYKLQPFKAYIEPKKFAINSGPADLASSFTPTDEPTFPVLESISEFDRLRVHYAVVYPHNLLNMYPDKVTFLQLFHDNPEEVTLIYGSCFPRSTIERPGFHAALQDKYYPAIEMALAEDRAICEAQQRGLRGRLAGQGRFSIQEEATVHALAEYVLSRVLGDH